MKISIGISYSTINLHNYYTWFERNGLDVEVELIDLSFLQINVQEFDVCDGFILTGGDDVKPAFYSAKEDYPNRPPSFHPRRDTFETKLIEYAIDNNKPLLGICRGLQLINVFYGGKLIQDLAEEGNALHKSAGGTDKQHEVSIVQNTLLHNICNNTQGSVNSAHHQAAHPNFIGENLMENAWSGTENKVIEGLEFLDKSDRPFMLCVQWHPERIAEQANPLAGKILHCFLQEVRAIKQK